METYFLIINPKAGNSSTKKAIASVIDVFEKEQIAFEYSYTEKLGSAFELAKKAKAQKYDVVVAVGGDGTVNEVARGLMGSGIAMGIIPLGSGNGFARELKISFNVSKAAQTLINGYNRIVDLWKMNDNIFLCTSGMGFDAKVAHLMNNSNTRGKLRYFWLTISEIMVFKPVNAVFVIDGKNIERSILLATFANAGQWGNNAYIAPGAKLDDGLLDVVIIPPVLKILYPIIGISLFLRGINKLKFVERYRVDSVSIVNASTNLFHFDGETVRMQFPVQISLCKENLIVRVP